MNNAVQSFQDVQSIVQYNLITWSIITIGTLFGVKMDASHYMIRATIDVEQKLHNVTALKEQFVNTLTQLASHLQKASTHNQHLITILQGLYPAHNPLPTKKTVKIVEGFKVSSDETEEDNEPELKPTKPHKSFIQRTSIIMKPQGHQNKQAEQREQMIQELEQKLEQREQIINTLREGYVKDVQHLKEMLNRQDRKQEVHDVLYFDELATLDPETREIVNNKLNEIQQINTKRLQEQVAKTKQVEEEFERTKKTLQQFLQQNNPQQLLKLIVQIETNPYKLWKIIQDQLGNKLVFDVFEKQKHEFGINYKEIDDLLQKSQASARIYQQYKLSLESSVLNLIERTSQQLSEVPYSSIIIKYQQEIVEKTEIIQTLQSQVENHKADILDECREQFITTALERKRQSEFAEIRNYLLQSDISKDLQRLFIYQFKRTCLLNWGMTSKLMKLEAQLASFEQFLIQTHDSDVAEQLIKRLKFIDVDLLKRIKQQFWNYDQTNDQLTIKALSDKMSELSIDNKQLRIDICTLSMKFDFANQRINSLEYKLFTQEKYLLKVKTEKRVIEGRNRLYETCIQMCLNKFIDKVPENKEQFQRFVSDFQRKVDMVYIHKGEYIDEIVFQHKKNQQAFRRMFDHCDFFSKETMTDINNTQFSLSQLEEREGIKRAIGQQEDQINNLKKQLQALKSQYHQLQQIHQTEQQRFNQPKEQIINNKEQNQIVKQKNINLASSIPDDVILPELAIAEVFSFMIDQMVQTDPTRDNNEITLIIPNLVSKPVVPQNREAGVQTDLPIQPDQEAQLYYTAKPTNELIDLTKNPEPIIQGNDPKVPQKAMQTKVINRRLKAQIEKFMKVIPQQNARLQVLKSLPTEVNFNISAKIRSMLHKIQLDNDSNQSVIQVSTPQARLIDSVTQIHNQFLPTSQQRSRNIIKAPSFRKNTLGSIVDDDEPLSEIPQHKLKPKSRAQFYFGGISQSSEVQSQMSQQIFDITSPPTKHLADKSHIIDTTNWNHSHINFDFPTQKQRAVSQYVAQRNMQSLTPKEIPNQTKPRQTKVRVSKKHSWQTSQ